MLTELVDYDYYINTYGGSSIPELSFANYVIKASSKINLYTYNRITSDLLDDNIRNTACEIAELLYYQDTLIINQDDTTTDKASETVGAHSVTYVNKSTLQANRILSSAELDGECYAICYSHLAMTGLMFEGVC